MARLDGAIEKLFKEYGEEIVFETGSGIRLKAGGETKVLVRQPLTTQQIFGALGEIVPADIKGDFPHQGSTTFPYAAPAGPVRILLELEGETARVSVTPWMKLERPATKSPAPAPAPEPEEAVVEEFESEEEAERSSPLAALHLVSPPPAPRAPTLPATKEVERKPRTPEPARAPEPGPRPHAVASDAAREMNALLQTMLDRRASDLHLSSGTVPMLRRDGDIEAIDGLPELTHERLTELLWSIAPAKNREEWDERKDTDFAHETADARFRVNVFEDRRGIGAVLRQIPTKVRSAEEMGLSKHILDLCFLTKGLVLVTGPTGSGKSTTLAAMIDFINRNRSDHIITIEDPIEFVHPNKRCLVNQREVGLHTGSFKQALRAALREDPNVVLVGELRDLETISIAIETAETGHLVFGTLHTNTAGSTVDRVIDQFPPDRQAQVRTMLSESLKGVIAQTLCKKIGGGRVPAQEVLLVNHSVSNLIREAKTFQIPSILQTGRAQGMVTLNDALFELVKRKVVEPKEALQKAVQKSEFRQQLERGGFKVDEGTAG